MGGSPRELSRELKKTQVVSLLERTFSNGVLLKVVVVAQANRPTVGRLHPHPTIGAAPHVGAFDREPLASWYRAMMLPHPGPVRGAVAR